MQLSNLIAVVTGAASGMGRAIAQGYAAKGARVVATDINETAMADLVGEIEQAGGVVESVVLDVSDPAACISAIEGVLERHGRLDVLVNSAGIGLVKPLAQVTAEDWDRVYAINVRGLFLLSQAAMAAMKRQKSGRIINLASIAGRRGEAMVAAYCSSKAAVISITQALSEEGAPDGVTVNAMAPGIVDTPFWRESDRRFAELLGKQPGQHFAETVAKIPLGRAEKPEDVVPLAVFLASEGSSYITGQTINIDGGITLS